MIYVFFESRFNVTNIMMEIKIFKKLFLLRIKEECYSDVSEPGNKNLF